MILRVVKAILITVALCLLFPAAALGYEIPQIIRVGLESRYMGADKIDILNGDISLGYGTDTGRGQYGVFTAGSGFSVRVSDGQAVLYDGSAVVAVLQSGDNIAGVGEPINLGERRYRGAIEFRVSGLMLMAVNCLTIEEYLYSVVPSEMPQAWHIEALKAQAVAARSYAMTRLSAHRDQGYHFCDRVHCQNYLGAGNEAERTTMAVNATAGVIAYHNGAPIHAVYSSSNGGYSSASEDTWSEAVPYLRPIEDAYEISGKQWERSFTLPQIQLLLTEDIGSVMSVYIGKTAPSGRVLELIIEGTYGSKTLTKEGIRTFFSHSGGGMLESTNFIMRDVNMPEASGPVYVAGVDSVAQKLFMDLYILTAGGESVHVPSTVTVVGKDSSMVYGASGGSQQGSMVVFTGRGWGHGAGMSQFGAKDMAEAGFDYVQILKYYYTGIEVG